MITCILKKKFQTTRIEFVTQLFKGGMNEESTVLCCILWVFNLLFVLFFSRNDLRNILPTSGVDTEELETDVSRLEKEVTWGFIC